MPTCNRCGRVKASADMRRSPKGGHLCKDDAERCQRIARAGEWPEQIEQLARETRSHAEAVLRQCESEDVMRALAHVRHLNDAYSELGLALAIRAKREGHTQKAIAQTLNVPASMLTGLKHATL